MCKLFDVLRVERPTLIKFLLRNQVSFSLVSGLLPEVALYPGDRLYQNPQEVQHRSVYYTAQYLHRKLSITGISSKECVYWGVIFTFKIFFFLCFWFHNGQGTIFLRPYFSLAWFFESSYSSLCKSSEYRNPDLPFWKILHFTFLMTIAVLFYYT